MTGNGLGNWTEERTEMLKRLWANGDSCSVIAATMGGLTRNAVIGKVYRLGLVSRKTMDQSHRKRGPGRRRFVFPSMAKISDVEEIVARSKAPDHLGLKLHELRDGLFECRYIHGDNQETPYTFCAQPVQPGSSFCAYHHRLCYNGVPPRPRKTSFSERRAA